MSIERMIKLQRSDNVYPIERIIAATSYLTTGMVGFVWLIIATVMKKRITEFLLYHIFQAIFITIAYFLIAVIFSLLYRILYIVPIVNVLPYFLNMPIPVLFNLSIIQAITTSIILYLAITSFCGYYSYLPWVSDIINQNTGRKY